MSAARDIDGSFAGAAAAAPRQMLRLTQGQRINRAAELGEAGRLLAVATETAKRRNKVIRPSAREPAKK